MARKKKRKKKKAFIMLCLIFLCIYGGIKGGEFLALKLQKPVGENSSALSGVKSGGKTGTEYVLAEDDMVSLTSLVNEFINAEHRKKNERLALIVDHDYYNTFLKENKNLNSGEAVIQNISFKKMSAERVEIEVSFIKGPKKGSEVIIWKRVDKSWKVSKVER